MGIVCSFWKILLPSPMTTMAQKLHTSACRLLAAVLASSASSSAAAAAAERAALPPELRGDTTAPKLVTDPVVEPGRFRFCCEDPPEKAL